MDELEETRFIDKNNNKCNKMIQKRLQSWNLDNIEVANDNGLTEDQLLAANPKLKAKMFKNDQGVNIVIIHKGDLITIPAKNIQLAQGHQQHHITNQLNLEQDPAQYQCKAEVSDLEFYYSWSCKDSAKYSDILLSQVDKMKVADSFQDARNQINNAHEIESSVRIAAINEINHMEYSLNNQEITQDRTILKFLSQKLDNFITKYSWAGDAITALRITLSAFTGAGLLVIVGNEVKNQAIGHAASILINPVIIESAKKIKELDPTLTDNEAIILAGSSLAMSGFVADVKTIFKSMKSVINNNIHLDTGLAYATSGESKFKNHQDKVDVDLDKVDVDLDNNVFYKDYLDSVKKVGPKYPINGDKAGKIYHVDDLPDDKNKFIKEYKKKINEDFLKEYDKYLKKDGSKKYDCPKQDSPVWNDNRLKNYKKTGLKSNGLKGRDERFYEFDTTHKDIQIVDGDAIDLGSLDPVTGELYRKGSGKRIDRIWGKIK